MSLVPGISQRAFLDQATTQYAGNIHLAMEYLDGRGLDEATARGYRLGVVTPDCFPDHRHYIGRLAIPYLTRAGVVTIRFRKLNDSDEAKYLSLPGDQSRLYNVNQLFKGGDTLVIVEGEMDSITVAEYAGVPCVGVHGVSNWKPVFARMTEDYTRKIIVGDGDEAGRGFAEGLAEELSGAAVVLPPGEDCNSILVKRGVFELIDTLGV